MPSIVRLSYTLLASSLLVLIATPQSSNALSNHVPGAHARAAQHGQQLVAMNKRMVKQRRLLNPLEPGGSALQPTTTTPAATPSTTAPAAQPTTTTTPTPAPQQQVTTTTTTPPAASINGGGLIGNLIGTTTTPAATTTATSTTVSGTGSSSTVSGSSLSGSSSSVSSTASPASTTSAALNINTNTATATPSASKSVQTLSVVSVVSALPTSASANAPTDSTNTFTKNTIIAIAVIAGCVGGAAAIWTLIRKWKLGPSSRFDERMQPIEWNPAGEPGLPGGMREKDATTVAAVGGPGEKRRLSSTGSVGSFHSNEANNMGRNVTGNGNMFAQQEPPHDFTAGPAQPYNAYEYNTAPYVDLQRNNSGGGHAADLSRARSTGAHGLGGYGTGYEYNTHDQAYAGTGGYEHEDAYAQDAYGGYETYGQQPYPAEQYAHDAPVAGHNQTAYQGGRY